jgi:signal transduction histidine kinase
MAMDNTLANYNKQIDALYRISSLIGKREDPNDVLELILGEIVRVLSVSSASISLISAETKSLEIEVSYGLDDSIKNHTLELGQGITGWVALHGKPLLARDVNKETRYFPLKTSVNSEMAVPLQEEGEVIGVINVDSDEIDAFDEQDLKFLTLLASEAGRVVGRVWYVNQLKTKARQLQGIINLSEKMISKIDYDEVIENIVTEARRMLPCRLASFLTYHSESETLIPHTIVGRRGKINYNEKLSIKDTSIGVAIQRKKQVEVNNLIKTEQYHMMNIIAERQLKSMLCTPVIYEGEIFGVLNLYTDELHRFNNDEKTAFQTISRMAAVAIQNAKLYQRVFNTEDTMRKNERLTTLGLLAAEIAHEIRNPLTVIKLLFDSLEMEFPDSDPRQKDLSIIYEKIRQLEDIVGKVLEFGKSNNTLKTKVCLNDLIDDTIRLVRMKLKQMKIDLSFDHPNEPLYTNVNKGQIQQSILNLIINATQAMPNGGMIKMRSAIEHFNEKTNLVTYIQDSGSGVPDYIKDRIFDSFLTSKKEGTGLGLSIVRRILKSHEGDIELIESSQKGTTFKIILPYQAD